MGVGQRPALQAQGLAVPAKNCRKPVQKKSSTSERTRRTYKHLSVARTRHLRRRALAGEPVAELAREYMVHETTVRAIKAGRTKRGL
jgi:hypothetical protein